MGVKIKGRILIMEYIEKVVLVKEKESDSLNEARETLDRLDYYNEKVGFLISEWINDYSFNERPDPYKAIAWGTNQDEGMHATQSAKWFWEYDRIHDLIEMIHDYNMIMRDLLKGDINNE